MKKKDFKINKISIPDLNGLQEILSNSKFMNAFNTIDLPLRSHYVHTIISLFLCIIASIAISIAFSTFELFIVSSIFIILLAGTTIFQINKCLEDDVFRLEGVCEEIYVPNLKDKNFFARDYLIMRTEDNKYVKIYNVKRYKTKVDNQITVYFPKTSISVSNDDTYVVNSLYLLCITKRHA